MEQSLSQPSLKTCTHNLTDKNQQLWRLAFTNVTCEPLLGLGVARKVDSTRYQLFSKCGIEYLEEYSSVTLNNIIILFLKRISSKRKANYEWNPKETDS